MQLQELKKLVEYDAVGTFMAIQYDGGWALIAIKHGESEDLAPLNFALELARGGVRKFMTLDAVYKLVRSELHGAVFSVC